MTAVPLALIDPASSLAHATPPGHPEQPARLTAIIAALEDCDWAGYTPTPSPAAQRADLLRVHPESHVTALEAMAAAGGHQIDPDTVVSPGSWMAAEHAAGGATELVRRLLAGTASTGISLHRPPGHHAEPATAMGFCLLNSVAVAAAHALEVGGLDRVMIVDYDVHHGNGTNAAFRTDPRVLFVSVHQSPLYPGTGPLTDVGAGDGEGFSINLPVPPGAGDALFCGMIGGVAAPLARAFAPQLVLISAGFDAAAEDPLADGTVTCDGFATMTATLRDVAAEVGAPVGAVLEGGYSLSALSRGVVAAMEALTGARVGEPAAGRQGGKRPAAVAEARAFLSRWWPDLG